MKIEATVWSKICFKKYDKVREILKENNIDPGYMESGKTILHLIAETTEVDIAKMLLDMGVDINIENGWGKSPLIVALYKYEQRDFDNDSMVKFLIQSGAGRDSNNNFTEEVKKELTSIKQVLKIDAPEKLEKLDWLNIE
ncbi:ankyrin repeat domain-containing protein [Clostridium butyricum]|uniref:ankyrin repeat domain-containing protein n=1 Tax=Clostridium butyricum TaxID=1492 RepID=UPI001CA9366E|nr:ankyrin repeat domain-containing protein [Clostridium butyricum]MBZ0312663.1 ankyrin repeat domain-containing protein [Clostridium butyricum]